MDRRLLEACQTDVRFAMTQDDIDNGRLVCVIGIAPIKPAEFVRGCTEESFGCGFERGLLGKHASPEHWGTEQCG